MLSPNGIRAILFDVDGTLRTNRPSSSHAFLDFAVQLGAEENPERRLQAIRWTHYYWAQSPELMEDLQTYEDKQERFWTNFARRYLVAFGCRPELAEELAPKVQDRMNTAYEPEDWVPPDVPSTLQTLQSAGFRLAVLSNRTQPCGDYLCDLGFKGFFDFTLVAGEVNYWKPEPETFEHALERLGLRPEETVYVGDNYYADVVGAQRVGLRPVLIDPEDLFPDAGCDVIRTMEELPAVLDALHSS